MSGYDQENWVALYRSALIELEHARMAGRIKDARTEILARVEKLRSMPGLHADEYQAIDDALRSLRLLELEEERYDKEMAQRALDESLEKLRSIAPAVLRTDNSESDA